MKQTIEIEVPEGKKAIWKDNRIVFEDIKLQLPKTWEEFCEQNNIKKGECYLDASSCIRELEISKRNKHTDKNILPNKQVTEQHLALMQLHQLRDCYRQGWVPNYADNSKKWFITNFRNRLIVSTTYNFSKFLSFQSEKIAQEFLNNFRDLIEQAGDLI